MSGGFAAVLTCIAASACGGKHHGLLVSDGGRADLVADGLSPADLHPDVPSGLDPSAAEVGVDAIASPVDRAADRPDPSSPEVRIEVAGPDLANAAAVDVPGDTLSASEAAVRLDVTLDSTTPDHPPNAVDLATTEAGRPVVASPSGGCIPAVVSPSLAFYGVVGIDFDEDGIADDVDNCPAVAGSDQHDSDADGLGDICDRCTGGADGDGDGICDDVDDCPVDWNPSQYDTDGDRVGNRCDSQRCFSSNGTEQVQQVLQRLLRRPDFTAALTDAHWRVISSETFCRGSAIGMILAILDYRHRKQMTVTYLISSDEMLPLQVADLTDLQGPQPSAEEGREAMYLAEHDAQVRAVLDTLTNLISPGPFFYEFGSRPETNDPAFPTCATGRCIDALYDGRFPDGGYANYSVVVDMDACQVLGIRQRP